MRLAEFYCTLVYMSPQERRYKVTVSRLMVGGRLFSKGDIVSSEGFMGLTNAIRSGALVQLPLGLDALPSAGIPLELEEPNSSFAPSVTD